MERHWWGFRRLFYGTRGIMGGNVSFLESKSHVPYAKNASQLICVYVIRREIDGSWKGS